MTPTGQPSASEATPEARSTRIYERYRTIFQRVLSGSILSLASQIVSALALATIAIVTSRMLGPHSRGILVIGLTFVAAIVPVASFGVAFAGRTVLAKSDFADWLPDYWRFTSRSALAGLVLSVICFGIILPLFDAQVAVAALVFFGIHCLMALAVVFQVDALYARSKVARAALVESAGPAVQAIFILTAAAFGVRSIAIYAALLGGGTTVQFFLGWRAVRFLSRPRWDATPQKTRALLRVGILALPALLVQGVGYRADRILVGAFVDASSVGIYAVGATISELVWLPALAGARILWRQSAVGNTQFVFRYFILASLSIGLLAASLSIAAPTLIDFLFGGAYRDAVWLARVMLLGSSGIAVGILAHAVLAGRGSFKWTSTVNATALLVVLGTDVFIVPQWGALGAAVVSTAVYAIVGIVTVLAAFRPGCQERNSGAPS